MTDNFSQAKDMVAGVVSRSVQKELTRNGKEMWALYLNPDNGGKEIRYYFFTSGNPQSMQLTTQLLSLQFVVGDRVEVQVVRSPDGKYLNPVALMRGSAARPQQSTQQPMPSDMTGGSSAASAKPAKAATDTRVSALIRSTDVVLKLVEHGSYKKSTTADIIVNDILQYAGVFKKYLDGDDNPMVAPAIEVTPSEEAAFQDDDIPQGAV